MEDKFYMILEKGFITSIGTTHTITSRMTEISEDVYSNYKSIIEGIPDREGFIKKVSLQIDGAYDVEYIEIVEIDEE